jgi:hypothetical protein
MIDNEDTDTDQTQEEDMADAPCNEPAPALDAAIAEARGFMLAYATGYLDQRDMGLLRRIRALEEALQLILATVVMIGFWLMLREPRRF